MDTAARLRSLRDEIAKAGYDGFLVPMADEYQSEYVPESAQRIAFLSGFTGSAGFIAVLKDKAAFFTDGRYTLQASQQVDANLFEIFDGIACSPAEWLAENTQKDMKIAFDPWLHTSAGIERFEKALAESGAQLVPAAKNFVDIIWGDRPPPPVGEVYPHEMAYAGKSSSEKREAIATDLKRKGIAAAVITDPTSVAWLLNVRGSDIPNTPLPLSFAILRADSSVKWFIDPRKLTKSIPPHIGDKVEVCDPGLFGSALDLLGREPKPIRVDLTETAYWIVERLKKTGAKLDTGEDPCVLPKACKNTIEVDGMRAAHRRDGAALVKFFSWLEKAWKANGGITEIEAEKKLAEFRSVNNLYRGPSFHTIAGAGPNGAIVHYRATQATTRKLKEGEFFLLDSGGQYHDGTTDVTRTIAIGKPSPEMKDRFTRVLKGHIALASVRFPEGTSGSELDALARQYLWAVGLDYNHGTGHGVGSYLGVHEGPQGISRRNSIPLKPGMVLSNEPGYYKPGAYGIRIENLQTVADIVEIGGERKMLGFETLTLAPIDLNALDIKLMTDEECDWLNKYHTRVRESLKPMLDDATSRWLEEATRTI